MPGITGILRVVLGIKNHYYLWFADKDKRDRSSTGPASQRYEKAMPGFQSPQSGHCSPGKKEWEARIATLSQTLAWIWIPGWHLRPVEAYLLPLAPLFHASSFMPESGAGKDRKWCHKTVCSQAMPGRPAMELGLKLSCERTGWTQRQGLYLTCTFSKKIPNILKLFYLKGRVNTPIYRSTLLRWLKCTRRIIMTLLDYYHEAILQKSTLHKLDQKSCLLSMLESFKSEILRSGTVSLTHTFCKKGVQLRLQRS